MKSNTIDFNIASNEIAIATDYQSGDIIGATNDKEQFAKMVQEHYCLDELPKLKYYTNNHSSEDVLVYEGIDDGEACEYEVEIKFATKY